MNNATSIIEEMNSFLDHAMPVDASWSHRQIIEGSFLAGAAAAVGIIVATKLEHLRAAQKGVDAQVILDCLGRIEKEIRVTLAKHRKESSP